MNLNWLISLPSNLRAYGNHFLGVNGVVTKLACFSHINARMAQSVLCIFERRFRLDTVSKQQTSSKRVNVGLLIA